MKIWIFTGAGEDAGTESQIYLTLAGDKGPSPEYNLRKLREGNDFGRGAVFHTDLPQGPAGNLKKLVLRFKGITKKTKWFLNYIVVEETPGKGLKYFPFYDWFDANKPNKTDTRTLDAAEVAPKPFYVIAHMCNTTPWVKEALDDGANAIEFDLQVSKDEKGNLKVIVFHGGMFGNTAYGERSKGKSNFEEFIAYVGTQKKRFSIALLDIKPPPADVNYAEYGRYLAKMLKPQLPPNQVVFSVPQIAMKTIYEAAVAEGMKGAGFDISMFDMSPSGQEPDFWMKTAEANGASWIGMGRDQRSGMILSPWIEPLQTTIRKKKKLKKVYFWTLDSEEQMKNVLIEQVDGIIINDPGKLREILKRPEIGLFYKLAVPGDNPIADSGMIV